jgi:hypothetical protein
MRLYLQNTLSGLVPLYGSDFDEKRKLKLGEVYEADIKHPRNIGFHKKFFALLNVGHTNTKLHLPFEVFREVMTMRAGFVEIHDTGKGLHYRPKSISFAAMDEAQFQDVYSRVLDEIIKDIGCTTEEIEKQLINFF